MLTDIQLETLSAARDLVKELLDDTGMVEFSIALSELDFAKEKGTKT